MNKLVYRPEGQVKMQQEVGLPLDFKKIRENTCVQKGPPVSFDELHHRDYPLNLAIGKR